MKFNEDYYKLFLSVVLGYMTLSRTYFLLTDPQSTHRVAMATFWRRTFHHDGK
jgi:hypothetical protein